MVNGQKYITEEINSKKAVKEIQLESLNYGHNSVSIIATDEAGLTSFPQLYSVYSSKKSEHPPDLYFLGIGAEARNSKNPLSFPYKDACFLGEQFKNIQPARSESRHIGFG